MFQLSEGLGSSGAINNLLCRRHVEGADQQCGGAQQPRRLRQRLPVPDHLRLYGEPGGRPGVEADVCGQRRELSSRPDPGHHLRRASARGQAHVCLPGWFQWSSCWLLIHQSVWFVVDETSQADAPDHTKIPVKDLLGATVVLISCSYHGQEFIRVGLWISIPLFYGGEWPRWATLCTMTTSRRSCAKPHLRRLTLHNLLPGFLFWCNILFGDLSLTTLNVAFYL